MWVLVQPHITFSIPHLCNAPDGALFQNMTCYAKGEQISNLQYAQSATTLYRTLYETKEEQNTVNSLISINPVSFDDIDISANLSNYDGAVKLAAKIGAKMILVVYLRHIWALKTISLILINLVQIVLIFKFFFLYFTVMNFYILAQMENVRLFLMLILLTGSKT